MLPYGSLRPTRSLERAVLKRLLTWSCTGWGLPCRPRYRGRGELLPRHFTLTPYGAVSFLLHFPSPRGARVLPGTLPCGVRTFLTARLAAGQRCCLSLSLFIINYTALIWQVLFHVFMLCNISALMVLRDIPQERTQHVDPSFIIYPLHN